MPNISGIKTSLAQCKVKMTASTVSSTSEKLRTLIGVRIAKETDFGDPGLTVPDVLRLDGMFRFIFESLGNL